MLLADLGVLGLNETEARIYLALLELGGAYVSTLARHAKLPRVNCYHTLENLSEKGLVSVITKDNIRFYSAEPPQKLVNDMKEKAQHAQKILPELLSMTNALSFKPKIKYFEGKEGIMNIFEDILTAKKELLGYSNLKALAENFGDYLPEYAIRKSKKKLKTRLICPSGDEALNFTKKYYPADFPEELIEIIFINPKEFWFEHEITIYDDKVAVISLNPDEQIGMIFESPVYARSQTAIFNLAWLGATSFVAA